LREVGADQTPLRRAPHAPAPYPSLTVDDDLTLPSPTSRSRLKLARKAAIGFVATLSVALVAALILGRSPAGLLGDRDRVATALGFGIDQVSLTGHKFTADSDLFDALDLANVAREF
jgi:hypothetical protein